MEAKTIIDVSDNFFNKEPFIIYLKRGELNDEILNDLYKESENFYLDITFLNYIIAEEKYNISLETEEENEDMLTIKFYQENNLIYNFDGFLKKPKTLYIDIDAVKLKKLIIFSFKAYSYIKNIFSNNEKYIFIENEKDNIIELKEKECIIPNNIIDIYIKINDDYKSFNKAMNLTDNIKFDPLFLSSNFYDIFPEIEKTTEFEFILNNYRKLLLNKLKYFNEN